MRAHDLLESDSEIPSGPPSELTPGDPLAKRALHYLARGRNVTELAPSVLEAVASLDGAVVTDRNGSLIAFGHPPPRRQPPPLPNHRRRGTHHRRLVASQFGPVLKVSEDGLISCFLNDCPRLGPLSTKPAKNQIFSFATKTYTQTTKQTIVQQ